MTILTGAEAGGERRAHARVRTLLDGAVFAPRGRRTDVSIRNLSQAGARVRLPEDAILPEAFHLMAPKTASGHVAKLIWREGGEAGIAFGASYELDGPAPVEVQVRLAWAEFQRREMSAQSRAATAPTKA